MEISTTVASAEEQEICSSQVGVTNISEVEAEADETPVVQFYRNRSIFITGATGFLGKVLVSWKSLFIVVSGNRC